jgi:hypothetical protein
LPLEKHMQRPHLDCWATITANRSRTHPYAEALELCERVSDWQSSSPWQQDAEPWVLACMNGSLREVSVTGAKKCRDYLAAARTRAHLATRARPEPDTVGLGGFV